MRKRVSEGISLTHIHHGHLVLPEIERVTIGVITSLQIHHSHLDLIREMKKATLEAIIFLHIHHNHLVLTETQKVIPEMVNLEEIQMDMVMMEGVLWKYHHTVFPK